MFVLAQSSADGNSGRGFIIVFLLVSLAIFAFEIWALVDIARRPGWAFQQARSSKNSWVLGVVAGVLLCGLIGLVVGIVWFTSGRKRIQAAQDLHGPYRAPPPTFSPSYPSGQGADGQPWEPPGANPPPPPASTTMVAPKTCSSCGALMAANAAFCGDCGQPFSDAR